VLPDAPARPGREARSIRGSADHGDGGVLELTDLRRTFGPVTALDGLSFAVAPAKRFEFVGRNGAGKTTTLSGAGSGEPCTEHAERSGLATDVHERELD
jgi:ABC-type molybdenum transport system ATPase subunit/photorepair protein PhrA